VTLLGTVVRLQVQRSRLKPGPRGARVYDPAPVLQVEALEIGPRGCVGLLGAERVLDVHHADHPDTRNVGLVNGLSLLPQSHYDRLQARYGDHLAVGTAGESVLLDLPGDWPPGDLLLETDGEPLLLRDVIPAPPCVEFARFCLRLPPESLEGVTEALADLDGGARGHYARAAGTGTVRPGARLWSA
jgi:hypothetical protein